MNALLFLQFTVRHLSDGLEDLEISAQAFWKDGSTSQAYLVAHVSQPRGGRGAFAQWLLQGSRLSERKTLQLPLHSAGGGGGNIEKADPIQPLKHVRTFFQYHVSLCSEN